MWMKKQLIEKDFFIFLDIDGVLNTSNSFNTKYEIREENIKNLKQLTDKLSKSGYSPKIVLTSTWRLGYEKAYEKCSPQIQSLISKLTTHNLQIFDKTPIYKGKTRDMEISRFIKGYQLEKADFDYIILDDDVSVFDKDALEKLTFYKVNQNTGLARTDIDKIVKMLACR